MHGSAGMATRLGEPDPAEACRISVASMSAGSPPGPRADPF